VPNQIFILFVGTSEQVIQVETDILADMWAYSMAAAHLGMRHIAYDTFMVSSPMYPQGEAWQSSEM